MLEVKDQTETHFSLPTSPFRPKNLRSYFRLLCGIWVGNETCSPSADPPWHFVLSACSYGGIIGQLNSTHIVATVHCSVQCSLGLHLALLLLHFPPGHSVQHLCNCALAGGAVNSQPHCCTSLALHHVHCALWTPTAQVCTADIKPTPTIYISCITCTYHHPASTSRHSFQISPKTQSDAFFSNGMALWRSARSASKRVKVNVSTQFIVKPLCNVKQNPLWRDLKKALCRSVLQFKWKISAT